MWFVQKDEARGFTLIELMVVITIIGLMASVVLAALGSSRATARDTQRVQMVKELQKALELFRNANGGNYPCASAMPACVSGGGQANVNGSTRIAFFDAALAPYLVVPNETNTFVPLNQGSILYRLGNATNNTNRDSYAIMLRREQAYVSPDGTPIPPGAPGCVIRVGLNSNITNFPTSPTCF